MKKILFILLIPVISFAQQTGYNYHINLTQIQDDEINVELVVPPVEQKSIKYFMPKIIPGTYSAFKRNSPSNGPCLELRNVPGREYIQVHKGNFTRDILGCILVGDGIKFLDGDGVPDVTNSGATLDKLLALLPDEITVRISDR